MLTSLAPLGADDAPLSQAAAKKEVVKDSPDLGDPVIVIPMAVSRDGRGMAVVAQCANPDPMAATSGHGLVDVIEIWNTTVMKRISRGSMIGHSHLPGMVGRTGGLGGPFHFSPDGRLLLAGSDMRGISVFRVPALEPAGKLGDEKLMVTGRLGVPCAAFTAKGDLIITAYGPDRSRNRGGGQIWSAEDFKFIHDFPLESIGSAICFSPDEKMILTAESHNRVHLWDSATGKQVAEFHPQRGILDAAAFHPSGKFVAFAGESGAGVLQVVRDGDQTKLDHFSPVKLAGVPLEATGIRSVAYSPDGRYLGIADARDHVLRIIEADTGKHIGSVSQLGLGPVLFTADSKAVWLAGLRAPERFEIARLTEQSFRDMQAVVAAGNILYSVHLRQAEKAGTVKREMPVENPSLYHPKRAASQAVGVLAPGYGEATPLLAKLLESSDPKVQMSGALALAAIGEEILKRDPSLASKLKAIPNQPFLQRAMPWLYAR